MTETNKYLKRSDAELVKLSLQNQNFFLYLMQKYESKLLYYIRRISNFSQEESEDILQEVFIKVYRNLNAFNAKLKFSSWIYRITRNEVISQFRKSKARPQTFCGDINDEILNGLKADLNIEKELDQKYLRTTVAKILRRMDFKYQEVLLLKYFEGKNYQEMSDILKLPEGTVASLLNRAKKQFRAISQQFTLKI